MGKTGGEVWGAIRRNKNQRLRAVAIVEAGECCESTVFGAMLDEFTTYQVDGRIVAYRASDG